MGVWRQGRRIGWNLKAFPAGHSESLAAWHPRRLAPVAAPAGACASRYDSPPPPNQHHFSRSCRRGPAAAPCQLAAFAPDLRLLLLARGGRF